MKTKKAVSPVEQAIRKAWALWAPPPSGAGPLALELAFESDPCACEQILRRAFEQVLAAIPRKSRK